MASIKVTACSLKVVARRLGDEIVSELDNFSSEMDPTEKFIRKKILNERLSGCEILNQMANVALKRGDLSPVELTNQDFILLDDWADKLEPANV